MNKKRFIALCLCFIVLLAHAGHEAPYNYTYFGSLDIKLFKSVERFCETACLERNLESSDLDDLYKKIENLLKQGGNPRSVDADDVSVIETAQLFYEEQIYAFYVSTIMYDYSALFSLEKVYKRLLTLLIRHTIKSEKEISNVEGKINDLVEALMNEWRGYVFCYDNGKQYTDKVNEAESQIWPDKAKKKPKELVSSICLYIFEICYLGGLEKEKISLDLQKSLKRDRTECLVAAQKIMRLSIPFCFESLKQVVERYIFLLVSGNNTKELDFFCKKCIKRIIELGASIKGEKGQMCWDINIKTLPKFLRAKDKAKSFLDAQKKVKLFVLDVWKKYKSN